MPYIYLDDSIHIDLGDIYDAMSERDREKMYDYLIEDGYGNSFDRTYEPRNVIEWEFNEIIDKIAANRLLLTSEEDEMLKKIASRF